jgi:hypothetical protein
MDYSFISTTIKDLKNWIPSKWALITYLEISITLRGDKNVDAWYFPEHSNLPPIFNGLFL